MRITLIGSGNVATHLGAAFTNAGHSIMQVYSPTLQNAVLLAYHVKAAATDNLSDISADTDMFVIAIKDDAIAETAAKLAPHNKLIVHTSGATGLDVLLSRSPKAGVFYPLQTFSKTREVKFTDVPVCIEGADENIHAVLTELAQSVSNKVYRVNSEQRKILHLAAVFACNFPNYLYNVASQLLAEHGMGFDVIRPLINETAQKVQENIPASVQTGPAVRNDEKTMQGHLHLLAHQPQLQQIYQLLSQGIIKMDKIG
ncbi:DUF2520 domain-containing protein [Mucilaginibacter hurinus]|uniref:DUF2520 domain-containing protein n=1 Tax=Mucilaginibacter hurinus TaxID=2201324 RepID=A0A367GSN5_9SPHI|nr:Rossmann-like and DUF2520 domain-containing protein [Mucilaginibacter hurinus]RCH56168.1 DUF2520 domain-containing protein [Mucilaginibacter hurinus]